MYIFLSYVVLWKRGKRKCLSRKKRKEIKNGEGKREHCGFTYFLALGIKRTEVKGKKKIPSPPLPHTHARSVALLSSRRRFIPLRHFAAVFVQPLNGIHLLSWWILSAYSARFSSAVSERSRLRPAIYVRDICDYGSSRMHLILTETALIARDNIHGKDRHDIYIIWMNFELG